MPPKPTILAFDTSAAHCAAALLWDGRITTQVDEMKRGQAEHLMVLLENMLKQADLDWADLSAIGVGIGPGNFTGIRISVSAARGLALGLGIPAIGVGILDAIAYGQPRPMIATLPAPRDMHYAQHFDVTQSDITLEPGAVPAFDAHHVTSSIARIAAERSQSGAPLPRPAPLYMRAADAAPPRDPAPVILAD